MSFWLTHTTLQVTSAQLAFYGDMIMLMSYMAHWHSIHHWHQAITDHDNLHENVCQVPHTYSVGNIVLIHQDTCSKLCQTHSWILPIDWCGTPTCQWYHHGWFESLWWNINIQWLIPFKPCQNHWGHNLSYHVPHQIVVWTHWHPTTAHAEPLRKSTHFLYQYTSPLAMLPSALFYKEGLYIFMQHSSKHWHGSLLTSLPHHHLVRKEIITSIFSSHSFHPTLISTNLFNSIHHMALYHDVIQ
jgi:hypothetical protein